MSLRPVHPLRFVYEYVALYLGLVLLGIFCISWTPLALLLHPLLPRRYGGRLGRSVITAGFRVYVRWLALLRFCRVDFGDLDTLRGQPAMIIAPNHPCLLDAVLIISRLPATCVIKAQLSQNLFLGAGARLARYIRNASPRAMVIGAADSLGQGDHLLMFPEGTRSLRFPVNHFTGIIGLIARRARVPIQTVFIDTDSPYLSKGWTLFRKPCLPINYRIRVGRRFDPPASAHQFVAELEAYFAAELNHGPTMSRQWLPSLGDHVVKPREKSTADKATAES